MSYVALDIFEQLRPEDIHWILASSELKTIPAGGTLVREDDPSDTIFFVADGLFEVNVFAGQQVKVGQLGPGEVIGEISWLDRKPISASVRAAETSAVMALSIAQLEKKLAGDPVFAARLFRGIATLTVERLRKTTSYVRRAQWATGPGPAASAPAAGGGVLGKIREFKALVAAADKQAGDGDGRVSDDNALQIRQAFDALEREIGPQSGDGAVGLGDAVQAELLPFVQLTETGSRYYGKPRGYAGDFQTLEMIYKNAPAGLGRIGRLLDSCMLNLAAAKAIRNRRHQLASEILSAFGGAAKDYHLASLACGPAREIFDVFERADDRGRLHVSCIDVDREALAHVDGRAKDQNLADRLRTVHANLIHLATGRQEVDLPPQDLVYSAGLMDYLSDELALAVINWIHGRLRSGGRVILGTFHPRNPSRGLMDQVLDWRLTYRDEGAVNQLFAASKFGQAASRMLPDADGVSLFAECRKA